MANHPVVKPKRIAHHPRRYDRRARALQVQERASRRTPAEQLRRLDVSGYVATKERAKLALKISKGA